LGNTDDQSGFSVDIFEAPTLGAPQLLAKGQQEATTHRPGEDHGPWTEQDGFDGIIKQKSQHGSGHKRDHQRFGQFSSIGVLSQHPFRNTLQPRPVEAEDRQDGSALDGHRVGIAGFGLGYSQETLSDQQVAGGRNRQVLGKALYEAENQGSPPVHRGSLGAGSGGRGRAKVGGPASRVEAKAKPALSPEVPMSLLALRGTLLSAPSPRRGEVHADGLILIEDGLIREIGPAERWIDRLPPGTVLQDCRPYLLVPGFVDVHVHFPQVDVLASFGAQLLDWLERFTFPAERRFEDPTHAEAMAPLFCDRLVSNGITTAMVMGSVHAVSAEALFAEAQRRGLRMDLGKVHMDQHCPDWLRDDPRGGIAAARALADRWHGRDRLRYAITPRFAVSCSPEMLAAAGAWAREFPDLPIQTHLSENLAEIAFVRELYPEAKSYLDVYDQCGLVRSGSVFAHGIHLNETDRGRLAETEAAIAFCPSSNLFLGSGLFDLAAADAAGVRVGLGSDVGGGTGFSPLRTLGDAYKVLQLRGQSLDPVRALHLATAGGAQALGLSGRVGRFAVGMEADIVALNPACTPELARRTSLRADPWDQFFALMILGDDRAVAATWAAGRPVFGTVPTSPIAATAQ